MQYRPLLNWYISNVLGVRSQQEHEDLLAETLAQAWRYWTRFDGKYPKAWLQTICRNCKIGDYRKAQTRPTETGLPDDVDLEFLCELAPSGEEIYLEDELGPELLVALESINFLQAEAFMLHNMWDRSYAEIAKVQGVPIGTVQSRISRARISLRKALT